MAKPTALFTWGASSGTKTAPDAGQQSAGAVFKTKITFDVWNYMWNTVGQWLAWLNQIDSTQIPRSSVDPTTVDAAIAAIAVPKNGSPTESYDVTGVWSGSTSADGTTTTTRGAFGQLATIANGTTTITITRDAAGTLTSMTEA